MATSCLLVLFLRGGADGLSLVAPSGDPHYLAARPGRLRVNTPARRSRLLLDNPLADVGFCFHPAAAELAELYDVGELAVVEACGLKDATRSHFDAEMRLERAHPGGGSETNGWLARWLTQLQPGGLLPALAIGSAAPESLRGWGNLAVTPSLSQLRLAPRHGYASAIRRVLSSHLASDPNLGASLRQLERLGGTIEERVGLEPDGTLKPYAPRAPYPDNNPLTEQLQAVAQAIQLDLGLRVACVDFGGWDTHVNQAQELPPLIEQLSQALAAFWSDVGASRGNVHVVVLSEFGRRLRANDSGGTDHGHGNLMLLLGPKLRGGRMFGAWPGLDNAALDQGADLAITTDYRRVLAEVLARMEVPTTHSGEPEDPVFPGFAESPLGLYS